MEKELTVNQLQEACKKILSFQNIPMRAKKDLAIVYILYRTKIFPKNLFIQMPKQTGVLPVGQTQWRWS